MRTEYLTRWVSAVGTLPTSHDMGTIAYIVGGALILFAVSGVWSRLNSKY